MTPLPISAQRLAPWIALLAIAGSVLIHLAVLSHNPWLEWLALDALIAVPLVDGLWRGSAAAWLWFLGLAAAAALLVSLSGAALALYLPSVLLPAALAALFGRSCFAGRVPLVVQIARAAAQVELPEKLVHYSRRLTQMWFAIFAAMALSAALLALSGRRELWSLVTNFGNYLLIAAVVLLEYWYRRRRFTDFPHPEFVEYLRILVRSNPRQLP